MKYYYKYLIILFFGFSCKNSEERKISVKELQLEFLTSISKDTSIFTKYYKNAYVFKKRFFNVKKPLTENGEIRWISEVELISKYLNIKDTTFVYNQIQSDNFILDDLIEAGFKTINYDELIDRSYIGDTLVEKKLVSQDSLDKVFKLLEKHKHIYILKPVFNQRQDLAFIQVDYKEFSGSSFIYKKKNNQWVLEKEVGSWMR